MKLEFDSIADIDQFMQYAVHLGRQFLASASVTNESPKENSLIETESNEVPAQAAQGEDGSFHATVAKEAKPKRARRAQPACTDGQVELAPDAPNQDAAAVAATDAPQVETTAPGAPRVVSSIEHLRACQSFIQVHGMAKYNDSFCDGLNGNITAYTPEQRSQHVAILEQLAA